MTDLNYQTVPATGARYGVGQWLAWVVIVLSIATIASLPLIFRDRLLAAAAKATEERPDVQLALSARYVVGIERALPLKAAGAKSVSPKLIGSLDEAAVTSTDKLRVAMVRAELEGKDAALRDIELLHVTNPTLRADADILRGIYAGGGAKPLGTARWEDFHKRHGWFADLAASFGKPNSDPLRTATLHAALRTVVTMILMGLLTFGTATVGLVFLILWIVFLAQGKWRFGFGISRALPANRRAYIEAFAMYLGGVIVLGIVIKYVLRLSGMWGAAALPVAFIMATIWPRLRGQTWAEWRATVGMHTGQGVVKELFCGAVGYVAGLPMFAAGILVTMILSKLAGAHPSHPIVQEISAEPWTVLSLLLLASVWAPITEELMFRGTLFGHLRGRLGWWPSALIVSIIFAAIHPQGWAAIPALASLAMVLAGIREWRGSILGCMMAHAINNTVLIVALVLMIS